VLTSAVIFLAGLFWTPEPAPLQADQPQSEHQKARRRQARNGVLRLLCLGLGALLLLVNAIRGLGSIDDVQGFAVLLALYSSLILLVQRAEKNRRLATLVFMAFSAWMVSRYAAYRDLNTESDWAILGSLLINYLFWLTIGRRFPVGSSRDIQVWGMDE